MNLTQNQRIGIFVLLSIVMMTTRINHFSAIPDATWAVFFLGGFYLRGMSRIGFVLLMTLAVGIDYVVITGMGLSFWSHYCVSAAYWFLAPAYLAMWLGGDWLERHYTGLTTASLAQLAASAFVAISVCFVISNGSFYWLSASVPARSFSGWMTNLADWYLPYLGTTALYLGVAAVLHVLAVQLVRSLPGHRHGIQH